MTHLNIADVDYFLPDGRQLLSGVSFRVGNGAKTALIGPNGTGKTTLLRIVAGDVVADEGAVTRSGTLGVMRQFVGQVRDESTVRDLLLSVSPARIRDAALALDTAENAMIERDEESTQMKYSHALADWADVGGYETEDFWDKVTTALSVFPMTVRSGARPTPSVVASRNGWFSKHCSLGPTTHSCWTSRTTTSMFRASDGWKRRSRNRRKWFCSSATTAN